MKRNILSAFLSFLLVLSLLGAVPAAAGVSGGDASVCRIGASGYTTLGAALQAVMDGQTIVLLTDISHDSPIIASTRSFSIDLAGCSLSIATSEVYCLAATGGKQLSISNSSGAPCRLTVTQTIAETDMAAASNFGAVCCNHAASRIEIADNVDTSVSTNMIGVDGDAGSIRIGSGSIVAGRAGIRVIGAGTVQFAGDVSGMGSGAEGLDCRMGVIAVTGDVFSNGIGVDAQSLGKVTVYGSVTTGPAVGNIGVYSKSSAEVHITGDVTSVTKGVFAEGGTILVDGTVVAGGADSTGAYSRDLLSENAQGTVTIGGSVYGCRYGVEAQEDGTVLVGADAFSTAGATTYASAAVYVRGVGSMAIVAGNAGARGQNSAGVEVYAGGTAEVNGNVRAAEAASYGVKALSGSYYGTMYGSIATIDGTITAAKYILVGSTEKAADGYSELTPNGYRSFSGGTPTCYVYVKAPAEQAQTPAADPPGGAVASGTAVTLTSATPGAEIRYTLDDSAPSAGSTLYTGPIPVTAAVTIRAVAFKAGLAASAVMTERYTILQAAEMPAADPPGGAVASGTAVTLTSATPGAEIRYTLDGSVPSAASALYTGPIPITAAVTIRAVAFKAGLAASAVMTERYTLVTPPSAGGTGGSGGAAVTAYFVITASAGEGGSISPAGKTSVAADGGAVYAIVPQPGYRIADVLVDGASVGAVSEYRFSSVRADHTIAARFGRDCPSEACADLNTALWYHEGTDFVLSKRLFVGVSADRFGPDSPMTRAMAIVILHRLAGSPPQSGGSGFSDVPADAWYAAAAAWGVKAGVIDGYGDGSFRPNIPVTREQFAALLLRYAKNAGRNVAADQTSDLRAFTDAEDVSVYALAAVKWACGVGLFAGDSRQRLRPAAVLTRAEAAVLFMRFCREIV